MKKYFGIIGLLVVTIIWGGGFVATEIALNNLTPLQILSARFFIASVLMGIICMHSIKNITKQELSYGVLLGSVLFLAFILQTVGLQFTTPSKNAFLTTVNVVFVPIIALVFYKKKIATQNLIGVFMAVLGAGVLSIQSNFNINVGDILTLLCALGFAFQIFLTGEFVKKVRPPVLNFIQMLTAFILSVGGMLITGQGNIEITSDGFLGILYLGIMCTGVCYLLQTISQKSVDETKAAIILSMEAVFGMLFSILLLNEVITTRMIVGSALILGAVLVSEIKFKTTK